MKRILKFVAVLVTALVILGGVAIALLPRFINTDELRDEVTETIYDQTGLQIRIEGAIDWSVFPWLGLSIADVHVQGANKTQLAEISSANVSVKLIPLLSKRIEMKNLDLKGLHLTLVKNKEGVGNWETSLHSAHQATTSEQEAQQQKPTPGGEEKSSPIAFNIAKINVKDLILSYADQQSGQHYTIDNASLTTGAIRNQHPFGFELKARLNNPKPLLSTVIRGDMNVNLADAIYSIQNLKIIATAAAPNGESLSMTANVKYQQSPTSITGHLGITTFNLAKLLKQMNVQLPPMADPQALNQFAFDSTFTTNGDNLSVEKLKLQLDSFDLNGTLHMTNIAKGDVLFDFTGSDLTVDNYLPPRTQKPASESSEPKETKQPTAVKEQPVIPVALLQKLNVDGSLKLQSLTIAKLKFDQPALSIKASGGMQSVQIGSGFYRGTIDMTSTMDVRASTKPTITAKAKLADISLAALSKPIPELAAVEGSVNADTNLKTKGLYVSTLTKNLNGQVQFAVENGAFTKANFNRLLCEAVAFVRKKELQKNELTESATPFSDLSGSFIIKNGIAYNNDLIAALDSMNLKGDGNINLVEQKMDYHIGLNIHGEQPESGDSACQINEKYANVTWPLRCHGDLVAPACGVDTQRLTDIATDIAKDRLKEKLEDKLQDKLQDKGPIKDLLKNLFK